MSQPPATIPKIIHQTWKDTQVPDKWRDYVDSWKRLHPHWEYRLWTDKDARCFIAEHHPEFLPKFDAYPLNIQRADAIRYFVLYKYGGLYVDMDVESLRPIDDLLACRRVVIAPEPAFLLPHFGRQEMVTNAIMASVPEHPFFLSAMRRLQSQRARSYVENRDALTTTGPFMIDDVMRSGCWHDILSRRITSSAPAAEYRRR